MMSSAHSMDSWSNLDGDRSEAADLQAAVEQRCECAATLVQTVPVTAPIQGSRTWDVIVHVFELDGSGVTNKAYAWSSPMEGPVGRGFESRIFTALNIGPIKSPLDAVCATLSDQMRAQRLAHR